jgi:Ca2+/Na+ antiporter
MLFILIGLALFYHFLSVGAITQVDLLLFLGLFTVWCFTFWQHSQTQMDEQSERKKSDRPVQDSPANDPEEEEKTLIKEKQEIVVDLDEASPEATPELGSKKSEDSIEQDEEPFLKKIEKICFLVYWPLKMLLPVTKLPELTLVLVFFIIYVICEFIVTIMNVLSVYTNMSHFLVGLTLMVWGSDVLELFNMIIATKKKQLELGMTSILACQVICILVVVPLACLMRMMMRG